MAIAPPFVKAAKQIWRFEWKILMNGLAPSDSNGNYKRPINPQKQVQIPTEVDLKRRTSTQVRIEFYKSVPGPKIFS